MLNVRHPTSPVEIDLDRYFDAGCYDIQIEEPLSWLLQRNPNYMCISDLERILIASSHDERAYNYILNLMS